MARRRSLSAIEATAFHEAGHAVVAWKLGVRINRMSIMPDDGSDGHVALRSPLRGVRLDIDGSDRARLKAERAIKVALAGMVAQRRFRPRSARRWHAAGDYAVASDLALRVCGGEKSATAFVRWLQIDTEAMVAGLSWLVEAVASVLIERGAINGTDEVRAIFAAAMAERSAGGVPHALGWCAMKVKDGRLMLSLESGLRLDLNALLRGGTISPGGLSGGAVGWKVGSGGVLGVVSADLPAGWLRVQAGKLDQRIAVVGSPRHFGGRQWYLVCPSLHCRASVLWCPPGASRFASRQRWAKEVVYASQMMDEVDRAHMGQRKILNHLCRLGGFDPGEWDLPPKPKGMRWPTYNRLVERFDRYGEVIEGNDARAIERLLAEARQS